MTQKNTGEHTKYGPKINRYFESFENILHLFLRILLVHQIMALSHLAGSTLRTKTNVIRQCSCYVLFMSCYYLPKCDRAFVTGPLTHTGIPVMASVHATWKVELINMGLLAVFMLALKMRKRRTVLVAKET